jgi:Flp pilus assembly protein TadG
MRHKRGERGASALEMAFIAPVFLLMIFAIIEVALWMHARDVALAAAREGVADLRTASAGQQASAFQTSVEAAALQSARDLGDIVDPRADAVYDQDTGRVVVTVSGGVVDLIPGWNITVSGSASGLIENFRPDYGQNGTTVGGDGP